MSCKYCLLVIPIIINGKKSSTFYEKHRRNMNIVVCEKQRIQEINCLMERLTMYLTIYHRTYYRTAIKISRYETNLINIARR